MLISSSKKKKNTSSMSNSFFTKGKAITSVNVSGKKSQKTGIALNNLYVNDCN